MIYDTLVRLLYAWMIVVAVSRWYKHNFHDTHQIPRSYVNWRRLNAGFTHSVLLLCFLINSFSFFAFSFPSFNGTAIVNCSQCACKRELWKYVNLNDMKIELYSMTFERRIAFNFFNDYDARFLTIHLYIMTFKFGKKLSLVAKKHTHFLSSIHWTN